MIELDIPQLTKALQKIKALAEKTKSSRLNIEAFVHIQADLGVFELVTCSGGVDVAFSLPCNGTASWSGRIALKTLEVALKGAKNGTITFQLDGDLMTLTVSGRGSQAQWKEAERYATPRGTQLAVLDAQECCASFQSLVALEAENTILLETTQRGTYLLRFSLGNTHAGSLLLSDQSAQPFRCKIPVSTLKDIKRPLSHFIGEVSIEHTDTCLIFQSDNASICIPIVSYERSEVLERYFSVLENLSQSSLLVRTSLKSLKTCLGRVCLVLGEDGQLGMTLNNTELVLTTKGELGSAKDLLQATSATSEAFQCFVGANAFKSAVSGCQGDVEMRLLHRGDSSVLGLTDTGRITYLFANQIPTV